MRMDAPYFCAAPRVRLERRMLRDTSGHGEREGEGESPRGAGRGARITSANPCMSGSGRMCMVATRCVLGWY